MLDHGHPRAAFYPLGKLLDEHNIVVERVNASEVTRATLLQLAISGVLSSKSYKLYTQKVDALSFETLAHEEDDKGD